jgi:hypothetical protein
MQAEQDVCGAAMGLFSATGFRNSESKPSAAKKISSLPR